MPIIAALKTSPIALTLILTGIFILLLLVLVFIAQQKNRFKASDGTSFSSEKEGLAYEAMLKKIIPLYDCLKGERLAEESLGLNVGFLELLKEKGFSEIKTFMAYREDFKKIAELLAE